LAASKAGFPRFFDFRQLLETHIDFEEIPKLVKPSSPVLLIGAANVLTGEFKKFSSLQGEIEVKSILASAAVPTIFPAVEIDDQFYWDGLFSDNPPTDELIRTDFVGKDRKPDELWVIQINPKTAKEVPITPEEILDRRNEMIGNESLFQDLEQIDLVNRFLEKDAFKKAYVEEHDLKIIDIFTIQMSEELLDTLDYASKLDRNAAFINRLLQDGESQGDLFLKNQYMMRY
jgi:NTE family protein